MKVKCKAKADIGFILDSSGSLRNEYHKEKEFLKLLAATANIGPDDGRAGVVTFSDKALHSIKLNEHTDISSFDAAVDRIPLLGSITRIDLALRLAQKELFSPENGGRPNVPETLILLTDGSQTKTSDSEDPGDVADEILKSGVQIIVIGIGKVGAGINKEELDHMAGGDGKAYIVKSFDELQDEEFVDKLSEETCKTGRCLSNTKLKCWMTGQTIPFFQKWE